jgi:protein TonB
MFEDSLVESRVGEVSLRKRWTAAASISLQFAVVGLLIALPLLHPEALSFRLEAPIRVQRVADAVSSFAPPRPSRPAMISTLLHGDSPTASGQPSLLSPTGIGMRDGLPIGLRAGDGVHPSVSLASGVSARKSIAVSSGVSLGMLIAPIHPVYPSIARAAHVEGTVVVEAVISRSGTIESLHVLSGPMMLQSAAIDAIRAARYRPYRLNGEAVEVQTTITVNFRMGS